jgi:phage-related protein
VGLRAWLDDARGGDVVAGPGGIPTGQKASVLVVPDTSRFLPDLKKYIKRIEHSLRVEIPTTVDPSGIDEKLAKVRQKQQRNPIDVPLAAQSDEFTRQVRAAVQKVVRTAQADIPLTADGEALRRDLDAQVTALERMTKLTVPLDLGMAARFRADVLAQVAEIERLAQAAAPKVDIAASVEDIIPEVVAEVERATRVAPAVKIKTAVDRSASSAVSAMTTITGQLSTTAASVGANLLLWGPPIIAALAGVVAMAPAVSLLVPAVAGVTGVLGTLILGFHGVGTALQDAFDPKKADAYKKALAQLTPAARNTVKSIVALKPQFDRLRDSIQGTLLKGVGPLIQQVGPGLLTAVRKGLTPVAQGLNAMFKSVGRLVGSGSGLVQFQQLLVGSGKAMQPLMAAAAPLTRALLQIGVAAVPGLTAMSRGLADVVTKFAAFIDRASKSGDLTRTISAAVGGTGKLLSGLGNFLGPLIKGLAAIGPSVLSGIGAGFTALGSAITFIIAKVQQIVPIFAGAGTAMAPFVALVAAAFAAVKAQVTFFIATVQQVIPALQPFIALLSAVAATIAANIGPAFAFLRTALAPVIAGFISFLNVLGPQLLPTFAAVKSFVAGLIPTLQAFATQFTAVLGPGLASIGKVIATDLLPAFRAILPVVQPVAAFLLKVLGSSVVLALKGAINIIKGLLKVISGIFNVFAGIFTGDWRKAWEGIKQIFSGAFTAILGAIQVFIAGGVLKLFRAGMTAMVSVVKGAGPKLLAAGKAILNSLRSGVSSGFSGVTALVRSFPGKIVGALGDLGGLLVGAGARLIQGLADGIKSRISAVTGAVSGVAAKIKSFFPGSPIKEGPLTSWNNGAAGERLGMLLVQGLRKVPDGVAQAAIDMADAVAAAFPVASLGQKLQSGLDKLSKREVAGLRSFVRVHGAELQKLVDQRTALAAQLTDAKSKLDDAMKLRADFAQQVADATRAYGTILTQPAAGKKTLTAAQVVKDLQAKVAAIKTFAANIASLRAQGLSDDALKQLVNAGVEAGSATASALAKGGQAAIDSINSLTAEVGQQADDFGQVTANQFYSAGVSAAQGLVSGLQSQMDQLNAIAKSIADQIVNGIKKRLGIKSPSTVMAGVGLNVAQGLVRGMDGAQRIVTAASSRLAGTAVPSLSDFAGSRGAVAGGASITVNSYNPVPETNSETVTRSMRKLAVLGLA